MLKDVESFKIMQFLEQLKKINDKINDKMNDKIN
jgi:hypothetical protein